MKISLIMATARRSYYPNNITRPHIFDIPLKALENQTFTDFEFIIVDSLYEQRKDFFQHKKHSFPIKHVSPRPSIWFDRGLWALCAARNQGIIYSDGELVIFIDDLFGFGPDWLEIYWNYFDKDALFAQSLHEHYLPNGEKFVDKGEWVLDSRWEFVNEGSEHLRKHGDAHIHNLGDWYFGCGASASLDKLLRVNGFDENFDGVKSLEDCDLGRRLAELGCEFVFDKRLKTYGYPHEWWAYPFGTITNPEYAYKSNYPLSQINRKRPRIVVNKDLLTEEEINFVKEESPKCGVPIIDELFEFWIDNQQIFDLRELREERIDDIGLTTNRL